MYYVACRLSILACVVAGKECASPLLKRESSSRFTAALSDSGPLKITAEKIVQLDEPVSPKKTVPANRSEVFSKSRKFSQLSEFQNFRISECGMHEHASVSHLVVDDPLDYSGIFC